MDKSELWNQLTDTQKELLNVFYKTKVDLRFWMKQGPLEPVEEYIIEYEPARVLEYIELLGMIVPPGVTNETYVIQSLPVYNDTFKYVDAKSPPRTWTDKQIIDRLQLYPFYLNREQLVKNAAYFLEGKEGWHIIDGPQIEFAFGSITDPGNIYDIDTFPTHVQVERKLRTVDQVISLTPSQYDQLADILNFYYSDHPNRNIVLNRLNEVLAVNLYPPAPDESNLNFFSSDVAMDIRLDYYTPIIADTIKYIRNRGIKSKIAIFNIISAVVSSTPQTRMSLEEAVQIWLKHKLVLEEINQEVNSTHIVTGIISPQALQDVRFAVKAMKYLKFPERYGRSQCTYDITARNFIMALRSGKCQCQCYTEYLLAAAEEVNRPTIVPLTKESHVYVGIVDTDKVMSIDCKQDYEEILKVYYGNLRVKPCGNKKFEVHPVVAMVEAGFGNNEAGFELKVPESYSKIIPYYETFCYEGCRLVKAWENDFLTGMVSVWNSLGELVSHAAMRANNHISKRQFDYDLIAELFGLNNKRFVEMTNWRGRFDTPTVRDKFDAWIEEINHRFHTQSLTRTINSLIKDIFTYYTPEKNPHTKYHQTPPDLTPLTKMWDVIRGAEINIPPSRFMSECVAQHTLSQCFKRFTQYITDNQWKPIRMFTEIFPGKIETKWDEVIISIDDEDSMNTILTTYFPYHLWYNFSYDNGQLKLGLRYFNNIITYLLEEFDTFVTPSVVEYTPIEYFEILRFLRGIPRGRAFDSPTIQFSPLYLHIGSKYLTELCGSFPKGIKCEGDEILVPYPLVYTFYQWLVNESPPKMNS